MFGCSLSDLLLDFLGHRIVVIVSGQQNSSGVFQDWVRSAPEHEEVVLVGLADDDPWLDLAQVVVVVHEDAGFGDVDHWDSTDQLMVVEGVDPSYVVYPDTGVWILSIPVMLAREAVVVGIKAFDNPPVASDVTHVCEVFLAIILRDSTLAIVWQLISAPVIENAVREFGKLANISCFLDFAVQITPRGCLIA